MVAQCLPVKRESLAARTARMHDLRALSIARLVSTDGSSGHDFQANSETRSSCLAVAQERGRPQRGPRGPGRIHMADASTATATLNKKPDFATAMVRYGAGGKIRPATTIRTCINLVCRHPGPRFTLSGGNLDI
jgi:hypothetical protein